MKNKYTKRVFENTGEDFSAHHAAVQFLIGAGYSVGSMERDRPIGVASGDDVQISKWTRMTSIEHSELDGRLEHDGRGFRDGNVTVTLFEQSKFGRDSE